MVFAVQEGNGRSEWQRTGYYAFTGINPEFGGNIQLNERKVKGQLIGPVSPNESFPIKEFCRSLPRIETNLLILKLLPNVIFSCCQNILKLYYHCSCITIP